MNELTPEIKAQFSLEKQWQLYLQHIGLTESQMHPVQLTETKRAFFGAFGQSFILQRDELSLLDEDLGVEVFQHMINQVSTFWIKETQGEN